MTEKDLLSLLTGEVVEESESLTLAELCQICDASTEQIIEIIDEGVVEPYGENSENWRFHGLCVGRVRFVLKMESDLGINTAGAALVMELLEELEMLRRELRTRR